MMITGLYVALCALAQIALTLLVVRRRWNYKVSLGSGGNEDLNRHVRAHGNFVETVPMALLVMLVLDMAGSPVWQIHLLGLMLLSGRGAHFYALTTGPGHGRYRMIGMGLTLGVYLLGALFILWQGFGPGL